MTIEEEYRLSQYADLGALKEKENIRLVRHKIYGTICVRKKISADTQEICAFLQENPCPYFPEIYECIKDGDKLCIVEEYITGRTLQDLLTEKTFGQEETLHIALEICKALKVLHNAKPPVIYRDLKPDNVMLDEAGQVKLIDFDIARIVHDGQNKDTRLLGTPEYAAPEQYGFSQTDNRTDIYALGILLFYMRTGSYPSENASAALPGGLGKIIARCTCMDPKDRYQSVEEVEKALRSLSGKDDADPALQKNKGKKRKTRSSQSPRSSCSSCSSRSPRQSWLIPGFRTRTPWKMLLAAFGYVFLTCVCFTMTTTRADGTVLTGFSLWIERLIIWISQLAFILIACDYRGCRRHFSILKKIDGQNKFMQILWNVLLYFFILILAAVICTVKDALIG